MPLSMDNRAYLPHHLVDLGLGSAQSPGGAGEAGGPVGPRGVGGAGVARPGGQSPRPSGATFPRLRGLL